MKPIAWYDTECYPNFWLLRILTQYGHSYIFELREGQTFTQTDKDRIQTLFNVFTVVSFNGINYDVPMIGGALVGFDPSQLKALNDRIIVDKVKYWDLGVSDWKPTDHIDIIEVAPASGSQKQYAGRIHCKKMQDLPYDPSTYLTDFQIMEVSAYCGNDIEVLRELYYALIPQIEQRIGLTERYGIDLRSKSDAQLAEAVIKLRCEQALGRKLWKSEIDWNMTFKYDTPSYISFSTPQLQNVLRLVERATFRLGASGQVEMPHELSELTIPIGGSAYRMGIGGLHSSEKSTCHYSDDTHQLEDIDVEAFYPNLIINSGAYPAALGETFIKIFTEIKTERVEAKLLQGKLKKQGDTSSPEYVKAKVDNEGGKIMINGTFGKTGSPYSILFAPKMLIQTTLTGQLTLLMLIEWFELYGIPVVSANTDGIVIKYTHDKLYLVDYLIDEWQKRTALIMERNKYKALYSRDINNYYAIKPNGEIKRKGEYATTFDLDGKPDLQSKKNPDVEICSEAVGEYLAKGKPIVDTIRNCRDIRKFITIQKVNGGGVKMWGESPIKNALVREKEPVLLSKGWTKQGKVWFHPDRFAPLTTNEAYQRCFPPQRPEFLGKVVRWYYGVNCEGSIVYATNGNTVGNSYGSKPCMTLPDEFPNDIDYNWYINKCNSILFDLGIDKPANNN